MLITRTKRHITSVMGRHITLPVTAQQVGRTIVRPVPWRQTILSSTYCCPARTFDPRAMATRYFFFFSCRSLNDIRLGARRREVRVKNKNSQPQILKPVLECQKNNLQLTMEDQEPIYSGSSGATIPSHPLFTCRGPTDLIDTGHLQI